MPVFKVLCRIDAYVDYMAEVEADDVCEAAEIARDNHGSYEWKREGEQEFDSARYITLDAGGKEIAETECGDV